MVRAILYVGGKHRRFIGQFDELFRWLDNQCVQFRLTHVPGSVTQILLWEDNSFKLRGALDFIRAK